MVVERQDSPVRGGEETNRPHCEGKGVRSGDLGEVTQDEAGNL